MKKQFNVAKFGGTSNRDSKQCEQIAKLIIWSLATPEPIRYVVVSAPAGITDKLIRLSSSDFENIWKEIESVYMEIAFGFRIEEFCKEMLDEVKKSIKENLYDDFIKSRGEYMQGRLMAKILEVKQTKAKFIDTAECIIFNDKGDVIEDKTNAIIKNLVINEENIYVFSGYYGKGSNGKIKTFSRGGSDMTGAVVHVALDCKEYFNCTDVNGYYTANPSVINNARLNEFMTYPEVRVLSYGGAKVLHPGVIPYLNKHKKTVCIRNTNDFTGPCTRIVPSMNVPNKSLVGIVGDQGFRILRVVRSGAHEETGFGATILNTLSELKLSYEYEVPSGIDNSAFAIRSSYLVGGIEEKLINELQNRLNPDEIKISDSRGIINAISYSPTDFTDILLCLERNRIPVHSRVYDDETGQMFFSLPNEFTDTAVKVIHDRFFH